MGQKGNYTKEKEQNPKLKDKEEQLRHRRKEGGNASDVTCNDCYLAMHNCNNKSIACEDEDQKCGYFEPVHNTIVCCELEECNYNKRGYCTREKIFLDANHYCDGGCDEGWEIEPEEEE